MTSDEIPAELRGWWRITESQVWDADALDLLGPALVSFGTGRGERLRMLAIFAYVNAMFVRNGVSFTWEGSSEFDPIAGTGRARLREDGRLTGAIKIKDGDESSFIAERTDAPPVPVGEPRDRRDKWRRW